MKNIAASIQFRENLPDDCPPKDASSLYSQRLLRLVESPDIQEVDFNSHAALGYECTIDGGDCEWASCSMFLSSVPKSFLQGLTKYKRLRTKKHIAWINIDEESGVAKVKPSKHVDLWMHAHYSPLNNLHKVVSLDEYEPS